MAIKLYKSQLEPTTVSSNVESKAFASMEEAASIGKAWKGMVKSGEKLYYKYLDRKTDNEVLEKSKEATLGTENYDGLSKIKVEANQMNDPNEALKLYNDNWQTIFDTINGSLSGKMAQRKFKSWMTMQNIKDANSIKSKTTANFISHTRKLNLDKIEVWKKQITFGGKLESNAAAQEMEYFFNSQKAKEIFGNKLYEVKQQTETEIAFYQYKNVPIDQREEALARAEKDKKIPLNGTYSIQSLKTHFKTESATSVSLIKSKVAEIGKMVDGGILPNIEELNGYEAILTALGKKKEVVEIQEMKAKLILIDSFNHSTPSQIDDFILETRKKISENQQSGKGTSVALFKQLSAAETYKAKLIEDLKKDPITAASQRGTFVIKSLELENFLKQEIDAASFYSNMMERKAQAEAIGDGYGVEAKYLTEIEVEQFTALFAKLDNAVEIKHMAETLVQGFGNAAPDLFKQLSEKDNFLAHIGGLAMVAEGKPMPAIDLAIEGYLLNKNKNIDIKIKDSDALSTISKYKIVFPENFKTFDAIVGTANNIYSALYYKSAKFKTGVFDAKLYDKSMLMAMGKNGEFGGVGEYKGKSVHVPNWLESDNFDDMIQWLNDNPEMLSLATGSLDPSEGGGWMKGNAVGNFDGKQRSIDIFLEGEPHLVSVGYGKYKVAMGDHPSEANADPRYVIDGNYTKAGNNFYIIDLNKVRDAWINRSKKE